LTLGIPDFKRYVSREIKDKLEKDFNKPDSYDHDKISTAISYLSDYPRPK